MHQSHHATPLLPLVVFLLLCCAGGCLATDTVSNMSYHCAFDEMMRKYGPPPTAVIREVPLKGENAVQAYTVAATEEDSVWAPIRFKAFTEDLRNPEKFCTAAGQARSDFRGSYVYCQEENVLTSEKREILESYVIPQSVKMHSDRLFVEPLRVKLVVPQTMYGPCREFTVPHEHKTTGISNVDMALYVAAGPVTGIAAWAGPCITLPNGRPFIGVMNYDPRNLVRSDSSVRQAAHEVAHALGFGYDIMEPLGMLSKVPNVRGKPFVTVVSSARTKEKAREHHNCPSAPGAELEEEGSSGTAGSHWERRNAKDELMAGIMGTCFYTSLTMAAFEDMGFYRANWGMEEDMSWGRDAGCNLLNKKCIENGVSTVPDMFCTTATTHGQSVCTSDRMALGTCQLFTYTQDLPPQYQYFSNPRAGGGNDLVDFCPIVQPYSNTGCTDGTPAAMPGSYIGPNSRCVKGDSLQTLYFPVGDVCVDILCEKDVVNVRYLDAEGWEPCPEGGYITPNATFQKGRIICPRYNDVCPRQRPKRTSLGGGFFVSQDGCMAASIRVSLSLLFATLCASAMIFS